MCRSGVSTSISFSLSFVVGFFVLEGELDNAEFIVWSSRGKQSKRETRLLRMNGQEASQPNEKGVCVFFF